IGCGADRKPLTIKIWEFPRWRESPDSIDRFTWMKRQIVEFERAHEGVSVELTELTWERGEDKKRIAIAAGVGPDIITGMLPVQLIEQGLAEPVKGYMTAAERADFFEPAVETFTYDGELYGWPWYLTGSVMFLNLELFERYGVAPPGPNWNYDAFLDVARRLTRDLDGDGESDAYGFGFLVSPGDTGVWPFLFPDGVAFASASATKGEGGFLDHSRIGLDRLYELIHKERVAPIQCAGWDSEGMWQRFTNRRDIAMAPWGIWAIPKLRAIPDFKFDVRAYPAPDFSQPDSSARAFIGTSGFVVLRQTDANKRDLCMEFARFLTRPEAQRDLSLYGVFPSRKSVGNIYEDDELMARAQAVIRGGQTVPRHGNWAKADEKLQREFQLALLGEKPAAAAISEGVKQIKEILAQAPERDTSGHAGRGRDRMVVVIWTVLGIGLVLTICMMFSAWRVRMASSSAFGFLCPALMVFAVFMFFPLCWVAVLSFQNYSVAQDSSGWVGLENLRTAFRDAAFVRAAWNTLIYSVVVVPANLLSALVVASLIYPLSQRARSFFRGAYYLPGVASVVTIAMVWRWMFNEDFGLFNTLAGFLGLPETRWLTDPRVALWSVILTSVARPPGGPILTYLAALDAIPTLLYDAGEIDGASAVKKWLHITVPLLKPTTLFLALTITVASFQVFAQVLVLTDGGPGYATEVIVHRIYTAAIRDFDFGVASAMSLILFVVIMVASVLQYRFFRSEFEY
ncbi:extracellular solute-binding protein, partial [Candidatus Poribacteria bacterium]|nr:extracellular solute-binding protein [Candidatus Poribacteria bacterium]